MADKDIKALLLRAAENGDWIQVWSLLEEGVDPNATDENGITPLKLAMEQENLGAIDLMIDYGASVENVPGIFQLSKDKRNDWLCILFSRGDFGGGIYFRPAQRASGRYEVPIENWNGTRSLTLITEEGDIDAVDYAIDRGTNVEDIPGAVSCGRNLLRVWLTRGNGEVLYWRQIVRVSARYGASVEENQIGPRQIEYVIAKALPSIIDKLFPLTNVRGKPATEAPEKPNAEIRNNQIVELDAQLPSKQTQPEHRTTPVRSESETLVLIQESPAEAKMKKPTKHRRAHTKKWRAREVRTEQLTFDFLEDLDPENN